MAKKKNNNGNNNNNSNQTDNKNNQSDGRGGGDGDKNSKKDDYTITVVMKIEMHCEGCASKITRIARAFQGVESAKAETDSNKLTVIGKVDPLQIQQFLHQKTNKKVDLISPQLKKQQDPNNKGNNNNKEDQKSAQKPPPSDKPKEAAVTTAVLKLGFHCQGCIEKIHKIVSKTKGVQEMAMDKQKETVSVKGTMDVKALTEVLNERLKRTVSIVPVKKEKEGSAKDAGNDGDGGKKNNGRGGGGGGAGGGGDPASAKMEGNRMDFNFVGQPGFGAGYGGNMGQLVYENGYLGQPVVANANGYMGGPPPVYGYGYGYGYGGPLPGYPAHMQFNDENPNACSIM